MTPFVEGPGWRLFQATEADNDDLCDLFRDVPIEGELSIRQERDPDYFALHRLYPGPSLPWVLRDADDVAVASSSFVLRPGWLDGERVTTGYLCDLRIRPGFRGGVRIASCYATCLEHVRDTYGAEVFTSVVFDDNHAARAVLMGRNAARRVQPSYRVMTPFRMASIQFTTAKRGPRQPVKRATPADLDELRAFLDRQSRTRVLGDDFSDDLLDWRLRTWPGLSLGDFFLARRSGRIVGCVAPWDTEPLKRTRVMAYGGSLRNIRRMFDAMAWFGRFSPLPAEGECFRFAFLTHLEVEGDDVEVFSDLVAAAYAALRPARLHFMAALVPRGAPAASALARYRVTYTPMTLYAVHLRGTAWEHRSFETDRPGFEMALS